jgi:hypothetical protein
MSASALSLLEQLDRTRQELADEHPGWSIWYVFHPAGSATWHARRNQISAPDPDALRVAISAAQRQEQVSAT